MFSLIELYYQKINYKFQRIKIIIIICAGPTHTPSYRTSSASGRQTRPRTRPRPTPPPPPRRRSSTSDTTRPPETVSSLNPISHPLLLTPPHSPFLLSPHSPILLFSLPIPPLLTPYSSSLPNHSTRPTSRKLSYDTFSIFRISITS